MAREYAGVGSVHTFVGRAVGPVAGFLAGWMLLLDYLLVPALIALVTANGLHAAVPAVPPAVWIVGLVVVQRPPSRAAPGSSRRRACAARVRGWPTHWSP